MGYEVKLFVILESPYKQNAKIFNKDGVGYFSFADEDGIYTYGMDGNTKQYIADEDLLKVTELEYCRVLGYVDVCKPGYSSHLLRDVDWEKSSKYVFNPLSSGEGVCIVDRYGEPLQEAPLSEVITALEADIEEDDDYRRFKTALAFLKGVSEEDYPEGIKIIKYGY